MQEFQTSKRNFHQHRLVDVQPRDLNDGEVRAKIDRFAFTANNITYAVAGDQIRYWEFFPAQGDEPEAWGIIPVWGFADVSESKHPDIPVGDRLFGYFLPSQELIMRPAKTNDAMFIDGSAHRAELPIGYNIYRRVLNEPGYSRAQDDERILLFVLHLTAFCIQTMLQDNDWFGAEQVIVVSASSKTSSGLGFGLLNDANAPTAIGLTSKGNLELVNTMGAYDQAYDYDNIDSIDASKPTVIVDMSGNIPLLSRLHQHLGNNMKFTSNVGLTHWDQPRDGEGIIRERSKMFFAPSVIQKGIQDLGQSEWDKRSFSYVGQTIAKSRDWLRIKELHGLAGLESVYESVCSGKNDPSEGLVIKM